MKSTYKFFKIFLPIIAGIVGLSCALGVLMFVFAYTESEGIFFGNPVPILFFIFIAISIAVGVVFMVKVKHVYVTKIKKNSSFLKFASVLGALVILAITVYDFVLLVRTGLDLARTFKLLRLVVAFPFIANLVFYLLPKRVRRTKIEIPKWLRIICHVCSILWCVFGLVAIWFYNTNGQTFFKVTHIVFYSLATLFFLFEAKNQLLTPCPKLVIGSGLALFAISLPFASSTVVGIVIGEVTNMADIGISEFELIAAAGLAIFAFAIVWAYRATLKFVIDTNVTSAYVAKHKKKAEKKSETKQSAPASEQKASVNENPAEGGEENSK